MKRMLSIILIISFSLSLCACGGSVSQNTEPRDSSTVNNSVTEQTNTATEPTQESVVNPTHAPVATPTTAPTTAPTTEPTTAPTTEPTTAPTTEPTTAPTTEPTTEPTTAPTTEPPHTHSFSSATCTAPKTCSCGTTEGEANGHNWKDASYTSPKTCTVCGTTEGTPLDVPEKENYHGHVYTGGNSSKKYHYEEHCAGKNSHEITWEEVKRRNLGPCGTCVLK